MGYEQNEIYRGLLALPLLALAGCGGSGAGPSHPDLVRDFDFNAGAQGWSSDVSDVPADFSAADYEISATIAPLPAPLDSTRKALRLTSFNHSDDLWQFVKRQIDGLDAGALYRVRFDVQIASDAPENSAGVGGSPGASVFLKAGASPLEPSVRIENGERVFTLDKGNQANTGSDALLLGNVGIPGEESVYRLKSLGNANQSFRVRADSAGKCGFSWAPIRVMKAANTFLYQHQNDFYATMKVFGINKKCAARRDASTCSALFASNLLALLVASWSLGFMAMGSSIHVNAACMKNKPATKPAMAVESAGLIE